jgi:hypothetical protein
MQEILLMSDAPGSARYDMLPALTLASIWLAQTSGGDTAALARMEQADAQMGNRQSAASLSEVRAATAGTRGEWDQAVVNYEAAAAHWEALERPYDLLRALAGLSLALNRSGHGTSERVVQDWAFSLIEQLAGELTEVDLRATFLASSLVRQLGTYRPPTQVLQGVGAVKTRAAQKGRRG